MNSKRARNPTMRIAVFAPNGGGNGWLPVTGRAAARDQDKAGRSPAIGCVEKCMKSAFGGYLYASNECLYHCAWVRIYTPRPKVLSGIVWNFNEIVRELSAFRVWCWGAADGVGAWSVARFWLRFGLGRQANGRIGEGAKGRRAPRSGWGGVAGGKKCVAETGLKGDGCHAECQFDHSGTFNRFGAFMLKTECYRLVSVWALFGLLGLPVAALAATFPLPILTGATSFPLSRPSQAGRVAELGSFVVRDARTL